MTRLTTRFAQGLVTIVVLLSTFMTQAGQVRPTSLTIEGKKYKVLYRSGSEKRNRSIVTLDSGNEVVGEGFLLFRDGHTVEPPMWRVNITDSY